MHDNMKDGIKFVCISTIILLLIGGIDVGVIASGEHIQVLKRNCSSLSISKSRDPSVVLLGDGEELDQEQWYSDSSFEIYGGHWATRYIFRFSNHSSKMTGEDIFSEINKTKNKKLEIDKLIGNRHVKYWQHEVNGVEVKNDFILLHLSLDNKTVDYLKNWRDDIPIFYFNVSWNMSFKPSFYYWKEKVIFLEKNDTGYFYTFFNEVKYPVICWEVRYIDGRTILYSPEGEPIGKGIPAPSEKAFCMNGFCSDEYPGGYMPWRRNAQSWFKKWDLSAIGYSQPSRETISYYIQDPKTTYFYELAHGSYTSFRTRKHESYTVSHLSEDMRYRAPLRFAFIGSCEGMTETGPGTFSYTFRKGRIKNTVTIGYTGMAESEGWQYSLEWQDYMFGKMDEGYTMKEAFDLACSYYPEISNAVKFVGDKNLTVYDIFPNTPPLTPTIKGATNGKIDTYYPYTITTTDPDDDYIRYIIDWGDNTSYSTDLVKSGENITEGHIWREKGTYIIRVKAIDWHGEESGWATLEVSMPLKYVVQQVLPKWCHFFKCLWFFLWVSN